MKGQRLLPLPLPFYTLDINPWVFSNPCHTLCHEPVLVTKTLPTIWPWEELVTLENWTWSSQNQTVPVPQTGLVSPGHLATDGPTPGITTSRKLIVDTIRSQWLVQGSRTIPTHRPLHTHAQTPRSHSCSSSLIINNTQLASQEMGPCGAMILIGWLSMTPLYA